MYARRSLIRIVAVVATLPVAALYVLSATARRPANLGVRNGRFAPCPNTPNCVSTQAPQGGQRIEPVPLRGRAEDATGQLREIIQKMHRTRIVAEKRDYLHAEFTSLVFRYVDDLELWVDEENQLIHAKSASRVGYTDLGANRKRVESILRQYR